MFIPYNMGYYMMYPFLPPNCNKPPTVYAVLNSIVNGTKEEEDYTKIKDLAKEGRSTIFDFDYPLSSHIKKEDFETMILNHFLMRRIGFETVTAFRIQLDVKLNEIMPMYNKMFDAIENWNIFNDGEMTTRTGTDNRTSENINTTTNNTSNNQTNNTTTNKTDNKNNSIINDMTNNTNNDTTNNTTTSANNNSTTNSTNTSDRRNSELPQSQLENVRDGSYVTDYNYDTNTTSSEDNSTSEGTSNGSSNSVTEETTKSTTTEETENTTNEQTETTIEENSNSNMNSNSNTTDNNTYNETIKRSPTDKIAILREMQQNIKSIYTMIFKDLECLFYQLV